MLIYLISLTIGLFMGNTQPPNYYPSYTSAKAMAKETHKEMVVFFTSKACGNCDAAWSAFIKDVKGAQQYISTRMDIEDFDGSVCYNLYDLKQVPSWVILFPNAEVKETWSGGWKDASGNPTSFDKSVSQAITKEEKKVNAPAQNSTVSNTVKPSSPSSKENITTPKEISTPVNTAPMASSNPSSSGGFVLQAGYFGSEANAQKLVADLKTKGFSNFRIENVQKDGSTFYRIISKVFQSESEVNLEQEHLTTAGIKSSVKKI